MSKKTRYARKRRGTLNLDQLTEWFNLKRRRKTYRYNSKRKKMTFFGAGSHGFWGHGHAGRR